MCVRVPLLMIALGLRDLLANVCVESIARGLIRE